MGVESSGRKGGREASREGTGIFLKMGGLDRLSGIRLLAILAGQLKFLVHSFLVKGEAIILDFQTPNLVFYFRFLVLKVM